MHKVIVGNNIKIEYPSDAMYKWCVDNLIIDNPDFYKKEYMGKSTWGVPREIKLFSMNGDRLYLPFGCLQEFHATFGKDCKYKLLFSEFRKVDYTSNINLYDYQAKAVESALKSKNGILVMPCGSGKTQTALDIIARLGGKTLWLTHTQDLLQQSMIRAKSVLDTDATFGTITAGKVDIGTGITFATVQTMCKVDLSEYKNAWDVIIIDECQHCCGSPTRVTQFYKVVNSLSARYKIGLTATPKRSDGLEQSMFALLGGVMHEVTKDEVADTTCTIKVNCIDTEYELDYNTVLMSDGTLNYTKLVDDLIHNQKRYDQILQEVQNIGKSMLILANRVAYIEKLNHDFSGKSVCLSTLGQSKKAKAERKEVLKKLNNGELDAVFATYQLAKEGLDVPNLRYVIFATPEKDETTIIQSAGRVGRKADGKEFGTVIDFVDDFSMYRGWARKRKGYYRKIDAIILT